MATSDPNTLTGVSGDQITSNPAYKKAYDWALARQPNPKSASAIQSAQAYAASVAKDAIARDAAAGQTAAGAVKKTAPAQPAATPASYDALDEASGFNPYYKDPVTDKVVKAKPTSVSYDALDEAAGFNPYYKDTTAEDALAAAQKAQELANSTANTSGEQTQQDQDQAKTAAAAPAAQGSIPGRPNPLDQYPDYTYNLSMHIVPPAKYNDLMNNPTPYVPSYNGVGTVLIASGGRRTEGTFARHPKFNEDFYFGEFKMQTVVGQNARGKNSNVISMSFTLIEPYGFTFFDRLLAVANEIDAKNWGEMPFLMQIDFLGNSDTGMPLHPIPDQTKYIPFKMIGVKAKVSVRGAEYQCQAIPYHHAAYSESNVSTPINLEVTAKSVKEFFSSTGSSGDINTIKQVNDAVAQRQETELSKSKYAKNPKDAEAAARKKYSAVNQAISNAPHLVGSYTAAVNAYQKELVKNQNQNHPTIYEFQFDPLFASSPLTYPPKTSSRRTPMPDPVKNEVNAARSAAGLPVMGVKTEVEVFPVNAGTSIIDVINTVMRSSEFIRKQFPDPKTLTANTSGQELADKEGKPITWYRITTKINLMDFDDKLDTYSKKITYFVQPYIYYNRKFKDAQLSKPGTYTKAYDYIYTGKNTSILNFDIDFDVLFYTMITAQRDKVTATVVQQKDKPPPKPEQGGVASTGTPLQSKQTKYISSNANVPDANSPDATAVLVNDFSKSMLSKSRGDMISVNLKIIGDPELIKQDDVYFNPSNNPSPPGVLIDANNSVVFDATEIFAQLTFRTPVDIDDATGFMKFDSASTTSSFSGLYKMLTVDHEFQTGQFTQTLQLVRTWDQANQVTPEIPSKDSQTQRKETEAPTKAVTPATAAADSSANALDEARGFNPYYDDPAANTKTDTAKAVPEPAANTNNPNTTKNKNEQAAARNSQQKALTNAKLDPKLVDMLRWQQHKTVIRPEEGNGPGL